MMHYIKLYIGTIAVWILIAVAIWSSTLLQLVLAIPVGMIVGWMLHTGLFAYHAKDKIATVSGMMWLLPSYMLHGLEFVGMALYPFTVPFKSWAYKTLGDKVQVLYKTHSGATEDDVRQLLELKFTMKEQVARALHWFWEDEEYMSKAHSAGTIYNGDWVVAKVLPHKNQGEKITKVEEVLINLYWEGNRNVMANMYCEIDNKIGGTDKADWTEIEYSRSVDVSSTPGIGNRTRGYSHTEMTINGRVYPQFTYVSSKVFASAGYGSTTGKFSPRYIERFEANMRLLK